MIITNVIPITGMAGVSVYAAFLIGFNSISSILGLLGNGIVLHATFLKSAFRLDKVTILLIQNLATSDFLYMLVVILPSFNAYLGNKWNMGETSCYMIGFAGTWLASANLHFILFVAAHKFLKCIRPWRMRRVRKNHINTISLIIWVVSSFKMVILSAMGAEISYNEDIYRCGVNYVAFGKKRPLILIVLWILGKWVPFTLVMILNASLMVIARRKFKKTTARGIMTIASISILLIVSWMPAQIYSIMGAVRYSSTRTVKTFEIISYNFYLISVFGNPIIYGLQNQHFAKFVKERWRNVSSVIILKRGT